MLVVICWFLWYYCLSTYTVLFYVNFDEITGDFVHWCVLFITTRHHVGRCCRLIWRHHRTLTASAAASPRLPCCTSCRTFCCLSTVAISPLCSFWTRRRHSTSSTMTSSYNALKQALASQALPWVGSRLTFPAGHSTSVVEQLDRLLYHSSAACTRLGLGASLIHTVCRWPFCSYFAAWPFSAPVCRRHPELRLVLDWRSRFLAESFWVSQRRRQRDEM